MIKIYYLPYFQILNCMNWRQLTSRPPLPSSAPYTHNFLPRWRHISYRRTFKQAVYLSI